MKKIIKILPFISIFLISLMFVLPVFAEDGLSLDSSSILSVISQLVTSNWPTIIGIVGVIVGVTFVIRLVRKAAGK